MLAWCLGVSFCSRCKLCDVHLGILLCFLFACCTIAMVMEAVKLVCVMALRFASTCLLSQSSWLQIVHGTWADTCISLVTQATHRNRSQIRSVLASRCIFGIPILIASFLFIRCLNISFLAIPTANFCRLRQKLS
jgi:hypothetical protein